MDTISQLLTETDLKSYWHEVSQAINARWTEEESEMTCETCGGIGWISRKVHQNGVLIRTEYPPCPDPHCPALADARRTRYEKLCTMAQIPREYQMLSFTRWYELPPEQRSGKMDALGAALAFAHSSATEFYFTLADAADAVGLLADSFDDRRCNSLVLSGERGIGKTSLAVCAAKELLDAGQQAVYVRLMDYFDAIKERFKDKDRYALGGDAVDEAGVQHTYMQAPVLVLDEWPMEATDWRREKAEQLVNYRYTNGLATLMTTNLSFDAFVGVWGMTIGQRVRKMAHWLEMGGVVLRPQSRNTVSR